MPGFLSTLRRTFRSLFSCVNPSKDEKEASDSLNQDVADFEESGSQNFMEYINDSDEEYQEEDSEADATFGSGGSQASASPSVTEEIMDRFDYSADDILSFQRQLRELYEEASNVNQEQLFGLLHSVIHKPQPVIPTQKITWDREANTVDFDTSAMCLCENQMCHLKFGSENTKAFVKLDIAKWHRVEEDDSKEVKDWKENEIKGVKEAEEQARKEFIKQLEALDSTLPMTLWSGIPFHRMTHSQLLKSQEELKQLVKGAKENCRFHRLRLVGMPGYSEKRIREKGGFLDYMMEFVERADEKLDHLVLLQSKVDRILGAQK